MLILGINEGFDSSVTILENGRIRFAIQEERVTRQKNGLGFPKNALEFSLKHLNLKPSDFQEVCFSNLYSPLVTKEMFYRDYDRIADEPQSLRHQIRQKSFRLLQNLAPEPLKATRRRRRGEQRNDVLNGHLIEAGFQKQQIHRSEHHFNHAAAVYYGLRADFESPHLILSLDGGGDRCCAHVYLAERGKMRLIASTPDGHSIGNIYSRVTHLMGMKPHEHEYKLMGLAAYLKSESYVRDVVSQFRQYLDLDEENPLRFRCRVPELTYAIQPRLAHDFKRVRFDNLAAGLQLFTEDLIVRWVRAAIQATGVKKVLGSGGVFMNVKANKKIAELPEVEYFDVFPSCGDETLPFGAVWARYSELSPTHGRDIEFDSFYLGPNASFDLEAAKSKFSDRLTFTKVENPHLRTAELLAKGEIVGRCSGRMEFGARALGNRSLLSDPANTNVVPEINKMIKQRDFWMPFAPAMLREKASEYVKLPSTLPRERVSPYMMHTFDTTEKRADLVAGTHQYDLTARAQMICKDLNPEFHAVVSEFSQLSGRSVVLNTSFNLHGFPIVTGACDAIEVMLGSTLKYLMINDYLVTKR